MQCGARNCNAIRAATDAIKFVCGRCGKDHTEDQCSIDAVRTRQDEQCSNHLSGNESEDRDDMRADSPYQGVKKTVKYKGSSSNLQASTSSRGRGYTRYDYCDNCCQYTRED
eukprot:2494718-Rhodomonas_salina.5